MLVNCQQDDLNNEKAIKENHSKNVNSFRFNNRTYNELNKELKFRDAFNRILKSDKLNSTKNNKTVMEEQYGFTIDSTVIKEMSSDNYTSYTFLIHREVEDDSFFENLVVTIDSTSTPNAYIIKYNLNSEPVYISEDDAYTLDARTELSEIDYNASQAKVVYTDSDGCTIVTLMCPYLGDHPAGNSCIDQDRGNLYWSYDSSGCEVDYGNGGPGDGPSGGGVGDGTPPSGGSPSGGTTGGSGGIYTDPNVPCKGPDCPEEIDCDPILAGITLDASFTGTTMECIYNKLKGDCLSTNNSFFRDMLQTFNVVDSPLSFSIGSLTGDFAITSGETVDFNGNPINFYEITSDSGIMNNGSNILKMVTLSHELIHAYMFNSLESFDIIEFDSNGVPYIPDITALCNNFNVIPNVNLNTFTLEDRWVYLICEFNANNPGNQQWTHDLFNTANFDVETYREKLEQTLLNEHDWDNEEVIFKTEAINLFGNTWKEKLSEAASWIGLEATDGYIDYLNSYSTNYLQLLYITDFKTKLNNAKKTCN